MADFNLYTAKVAELGDNVAEKAASYLAKIEEVTSIVTNLSSVWGGPTYDSFKASYDAKLETLEGLNESLREIASKISDTASTGEKIINKINDLMN